MEYITIILVLPLMKTMATSKKYESETNMPEVYLQK